MLELDGVTRRFGAVVALDELSFSVPAGAVLGFLGPNGAGKTTAMRTVFGISQPDAGEVRWRGAPVRLEDRRTFGYLPEERGLYPGMRIVEQLTYLGELHGMSSGAARQAGVGWLERLGLGTRSQDKVEALSLGNQQRVQLAAALLHSPDLLVLDEPFSGLDPVGVADLSAVLVEQAERGVTVLFSSHQLDLVEHCCARAVIIDHGRVVAEGTVAELTTGAQPVLVVGVDQADPGWTDGLPGTSVAGRDGSRVRLLLSTGTDPQSVLRAAQSAGTVTHFSLERRRLSEVFLAAVGSGGGRNADPGRVRDGAGPAEPGSEGAP